MDNRKITFVTLAFASAAVLACGDSDSNLTASGTGTVNVALTDAPFPFSQVKSVDIFVLRIDGKIADVDSLEASNVNDSTGWKTLVSPATGINLLNLSGGKTANLGSATLPVGTYRSFRLVIDTDKSSVTLTDDSKPDIKWPSAGKNGIKLILDKPFEVVDGSTSTSAGASSCAVTRSRRMVCSSSRSFMRRRINPAPVGFPELFAVTAPLAF
jgi:hypothetical protein